MLGGMVVGGVGGYDLIRLQVHFIPYHFIIEEHITMALISVFENNNM